MKRPFLFLLLFLVSSVFLGNSHASSSHYHFIQGFQWQSLKDQMELPCETALNAPPLSQAQIYEILFKPDEGKAGLSPTHELVKRALTFLTSQKANQLDLAMKWELLAQEVNKSSSSKTWDLMRFIGSQGELIYLGTFYHALVINRNGEIFKGSIYFDKPPEQEWVVNYTHLRRIL